MPQPYPTPPRGATGQALWSYLYQLAEQLNAQAAPVAASEAAAPNGGSAARIAAEARQTAANALAAVSSAASTAESAATTASAAAGKAADAATAAANAGAKADAASTDAASALAAVQDLAESTDALQSGLDAKAPQDHASAQTTYGIGNAASYGHVRLSDATGSTSAASGGTAATPAAVKAAYDLASQASSAASSAYDLANEAGQVATDAAQTAADAQSAAEAAQTAVGGKAPTNHASTATTYGKGTSTNYGHVKLSDSILSTSDTAGGTAATPGAVKKAYDLANRAETTLLGGKKIVCGWSAVNFKNTGQQNTTISFGTTFTAKPIVIIGQPFNGVICTVFNDAVTTKNFTVNVPAVGSATLSTRQMAWVAIGSI